MSNVEVTRKVYGLHDNEQLHVVKEKSVNVMLI